MQLNIRNVAPALIALTLVLTGCKTIPTKSDESTPATSAAKTEQPAAVAVVELYIAQTQAVPGLTEVRLADGILYMQKQPVLTRNDLTEAAALVDAQGRHFVGLRFSEGGARKLAEVSGQNIGKMLALIIDRNLVAAPRINEPLNRGVLAFSVPTAAAATDIAARIRGEVSAAAPVAR